MVLEMSRKQNDFEQFLLAQIDEINRHKWIESEKLGYDMGFSAAAMEWISLYAGSFKEHWINQLRILGKQK